MPNLDSCHHFSTRVFNSVIQNCHLQQSSLVLPNFPNRIWLLCTLSLFFREQIDSFVPPTFTYICTSFVYIHLQLFSISAIFFSIFSDRFYSTSLHLFFHHLHMSCSTNFLPVLLLYASALSERSRATCIRNHNTVIHNTHNTPQRSPRLPSRIFVLFHICKPPIFSLRLPSIIQHVLDISQLFLI